jgi:hypothetical protein
MYVLYCAKYVGDPHYITNIEILGASFFKSVLDKRKMELDKEIGLESKITELTNVCEIPSHENHEECPDSPFFISEAPLV